MVRPQIAGWLLGGWTLTLLGLTFWHWSPTSSMLRVVNLTPLWGIGESLAAGGRATLINVVGNIVVFGPIGLLLPLWQARYRSWWRSGLAGMGVSLAIELLQWLVGYRVADVDDVLLNTVGTLVGFMLFWVFTQHLFFTFNHVSKRN